MRKYKAKIVGLKWSRKRNGYYYPVFEYTNEYGEKRTYCRQKGMEKTPFMMRRTYTICKGRDYVYEKTEKKINERFVFLIIRLFALITTIIFPIFAVQIACFCFLSFIVPTLIKMRNHIKNRKIARTSMPIEGRIVGYQKVKKYTIFGEQQIKFHPLISYEMSDSIFTHISKTFCDEDEYAFDSCCDIFIDFQNKNVFDELETEAPMIDLDGFISTCKSIITKVRQLIKKDLQPTKKYVRTKVRNMPTSNDMSDTVPICITTKTCNQKVSGWY